MTLRPQAVLSKRANSSIAFMVFLLTVTIYFITQNRSVTFWDVGEYIACSSILGVPHPPGNPFYIILGRFFCIIGDFLPHAVVVNAISGLLSALTVMFIYLISVKLVSMFETNKFYVVISGLVACFLAAFSFTFWNNAVEASVYPGRDFFITFIIWLSLIWIEKSDKFSHQNILIFIIYLFFLGLCIHQTTLQIAPAVLFLVIYSELINNFKNKKFWTLFFVYSAIILTIYFIFITVGKEIHVPDISKIMVALSMFAILFIRFRSEISVKAWITALVFIFLALSPHIYLTVRAALRPFINEGDPHNFQMFLDYILRRQYGVTSFLIRRAGFLYQMDFHFLRYFNWQFFHAPVIAGWLPVSESVVFAFKNAFVLILGFGGAYYHFKRNKHSFFYFLAFFLMTSFAMVFVMNLSDGEVRDRDYFFNTAFILWAVWLAIGCIGLVDFFRKRGKVLFIISSIFVISLPVINFASQYFIHDRSNEFIALDYGQNFLNSLEENAILFTNGDNDTFPLWYAQAVFDPHVNTYVHEARDVYPSEESISAQLEAITFKEDTLTGVRSDVTVANLSLLNTPWYIRHLRDREGVLFSMPDSAIDDLRPVRVSENRTLTFRSPNQEDNFSIQLFKDQVLIVKDLAIIQIIRDNYGLRPIYFAVTIPDITPFHRNVRNEGMVERLVPTSGEDQYDIERLKKNVKEIYSYRSVFEDNVYKDENMRKLINNYGASFMRISRHYHTRNDLVKAAEYMEKAITYVNNKAPFYYGISHLYLQKDDYDMAYHSLSRALELEPGNYRYQLEAGLLAVETGIPERAFHYHYLEASKHLTFSDEFLEYIFAVSHNHGEHYLGIEFLEKIRRSQNQHTIDHYIAELRKESDYIE